MRTSGSHAVGGGLPGKAAERGQYEPLQALHALFKAPYDEHPQASERYFRRQPDGTEQQGGVGFMS